MASGDIITASRYNQIQSRIATILGNGSANAGYGQNLVSNQVSPSQLITALHMNRLRTDMLTSYVHQNGSVSGFNLPEIIAGSDLISDAPSAAGKNEYQSYNNLSNTLLAERNNYSSVALNNNFSSELNRLVSTRTSAWGGAQQVQTVTHEFTVSFGSGNARRHFFNTGSQIRIEATLNNFPGGGGLQKFNNWSGMFTGMGIISFGSINTTNNGSGTTQAIGNFNLTSSFQTIFIKSGSSVYSDNTYIIRARQDNASTIRFLIEFNDLHTGSSPTQGVDEPVEGTLRSRVHHFRATGTSISGINRVIVPRPVYQNIRTL